MGVDLYACAECGETFPDCGRFASCDDCGEMLCPDCMEKHGVSGIMNQGDCPFCQAKIVSDRTLLAFLLNEFGASKEEAQAAFVAKHADKPRKLFEMEVEMYKRGYKDAVSNYAVWNDGEQLVGVMRRPLKTVLQEVDKAEVPIQY